MLLVHKIRLYPNKHQLDFFKKSAGVARFSYNWALAEWQKQYAAGNKPTEAKLRVELNAIKKEEFPWMLEVSKNVPQQAIKNLGVAFKNFFRKVKNGENPGYPNFKKKGKSKDSFKPDGGSSKDTNALIIKDKKVTIPRLGDVRLAEELRFNGKITGSTISRTADKWFIAVTVDTNHIPHVRENQAVCGVDVGISCLAALDNGKFYQPAKALKVYEEKLKRLARQLSRKQKGSSNRRKSATEIARLYYKISCLRSDVTHKATTDIILNNVFVATEDLNIKGMLKNHKVAKAISDASLYEFQRQLEYKASLYGTTIHKVDRWFPSTKLCMNCGTIHDMPLNKRLFKCACNDLEIDRDTHAAQNILRQALSEVTPLEIEALAC